VRVGRRRREASRQDFIPVRSTERKQETIAKLSAGFLPREVAEAQMADLRREMNAVKTIAQSARDQRVGRQDAREGMSRSTALFIAALSAAAAVVGILVTVVLAANGVLG
jgi:hypothetical protein